jgi:hypothetical protein
MYFFAVTSKTYPSMHFEKADSFPYCFLGFLCCARHSTDFLQKNIRIHIRNFPPPSHLGPLGLCLFKINTELKNLASVSVKISWYKLWKNCLMWTSAKPVWLLRPDWPCIAWIECLIIRMYTYLTCLFKQKVKLKCLVLFKKFSFFTFYCTFLSEGARKAGGFTYTFSM